MIKKLTANGDTIVEVLIAIVVISTALGLAYGSATRSLRQGREAQERTEALKVVEGQIEQLKYVLATQPFSTTIPVVPFCMNSAIVTVVGVGTACNNLGVNQLDIVITPPAASSPTLDFNIQAFWVTQDGVQDNVTIVYRAL